MAGLVIGFVQPEGLPVLSDALYAESASWGSLGFGQMSGFEMLLEEEG